ncbi:MAG: hypothetical protein WCE32_23190, partial [Pseudolabrys sp.]
GQYLALNYAATPETLAAVIGRPSGWTSSNPRWPAGREGKCIEIENGYFNSCQSRLALSGS